MAKFQVQVTKDHYSQNYDDLARFASYFYQIDLVRKIRPSRVLEVGVGNKTVSNYLIQNGIPVDTCDFDADLKPDFVEDIRNLSFNDESYDLVMACEVIEHIPWSDLDKALNEIKRVSKKYVLISIPHFCLFFELTIKFPLISKIFKKAFLNFCIIVPIPYLKLKLSKEHYWEMGRRGYSKKMIRTHLERHFKITEEIRPILNPYHYFFVLEKK